MKNITALKLTLNSTAKNPLRDLLRGMSKEQLLAEQVKASKTYNAKDTRDNFCYKMYIDYMCEAKGFTKPTPGIWV